MRKLLPDEERALILLSRYPSFCPGDAAESELGGQLIVLLKALVRKGRASGADTDDGPSVAVNAVGRAEAAKLEAVS